jgi:protein-tyrosine phosphatase
MISPISVVFVCLGNICRSPTAEAVFRKMVADRNLNEHFMIDSAGTAGYHVGAKPDERSVEVASAMGYDFTGISCRKVCEADFVNADYLLAMDASNVDNLRKVCPPEFVHKIRLLVEFANGDYPEVPDPYYGGRRGFELVLDLIEQGCAGFIEHVKQNH